MSVRPSDRRMAGRGREYRGPPWRATGTEVPRAPEKKCTPAADRRARTKRREKIISAGAKARERKKILFGRERKKKNIRAGAKKKFGRQREHNPQKSVFFLPIPLRSRYLLEGAATKSFYFESECKRQKYFLKVNAKRPKIHDD